MQGNQKRNQSLVDRGWNGMAILLDREMPQKNRRRGLVWWLTGLATLLVVSAAAYYGQSLFEGNKAEQRIDIPEQKPTDGANHPIASPDREPGSETVPTVVEEPETATNTHVGTHNESPSNHVSSAFQEKQAATQSISSLTSPSSNDAVSYEKPGTDSDINANISITQSGHSESPDVNDIKDIPEENAIAQESGSATENRDAEIAKATTDGTGKEDSEAAFSEARIVVTPMQKLAHQRSIGLSLSSGDFTPDLSEKAGQASAIIPAHLARSGRKTEVHILSALHMNGEGNPLYAVDAGAAVVLRAHKRLKIRTGVQYGYSNVDGLEILSLAADVNEELIDMPGNPGTGVVLDASAFLNGYADYDDAEQVAKSFHYLHVPLALEYRISPRFAAQLGVKASALLAAPARYGLDDARFQAYPVEPLSNSRSYLYDYGYVRKYDIAPTVGLSWQFAKRFWLDAGYSHGLVPYINHTGGANRQDYHRSGSIGLRYRII